MVMKFLQALYPVVVMALKEKSAFLSPVGMHHTSAFINCIGTELCLCSSLTLFLKLGKCYNCKIRIIKNLINRIHTMLTIAGRTSDVTQCLNFFAFGILLERIRL